MALEFEPPTSEAAKATGADLEPWSRTVRTDVFQSVEIYLMGDGCSRTKRTDRLSLRAYVLKGRNNILRGG